jgi:outer membrane lipoprotein-sorting protein
LAAVLAVICLLAGCNGTEASAESVGEHFRTMDGFEAHIKMISDLGQSVMEYEADYTYFKEENDVFTITAPESLADISGTIAGEDAVQFCLQYDGMQLDDAMPQQQGLTPADGLYCLLADLRRGEPVQQWTERMDGQELLVLRYENENAAEKTEKQIWLTADGYRPVYAELYAAGKCVLTIQVTAYEEI